MNSLSMSIGPFFIIATWVLAGFSSYTLFRFFFSNTPSNKVERDIDIHKKRYAKGEIDSAEFLNSDLHQN